MKHILLFLLALTAACVERNYYQDDQDDQGDASTMIREHKDGWQAGGELTQNDPITDFSLQANFPESGAYTVQFTVEQAISSTAARGQLRGMTYADITWTVEGQQVRRTVAVYNGLSVTGVAQAVKVRLYDASPAGDAGRKYNAFAVCARGTRASTENPPIYEVGVSASAPLGPVEVVQVGTFATVPVPLNIGVKSVGVVVINQDGTAIPDQGAVVEQRNGGAIRKAYDPRQVYWVPLSPGVDTIRLKNNMPGVDPANRLAFSVTWGIDG